MNLSFYQNFESAGKAVLRFLHQRLGFALWMITRTEGDDWIVLQSEDHGYHVKPGQVFKWSDSFCSHMVQGLTPQIAPHSDDVELYASAPIGKQVPIKAYIGFPLVKEDGSLFGTLCAIDPCAQSETLYQEQGLIEVLSNLLSMILQNELRETQSARQLERLQVEALTDGLTGLYNWRGWDRLLKAEEERSRRHGHYSAIYIIDLDGLKEVNDQCGHAAGDELIKQAAQGLKGAIRSNDTLARLGGDEFGILSVEINNETAKQLFQRIEQALEQSGVQASMGYAIRHPSTGLKQAVIQADQQMYFHKRRKDKTALIENPDAPCNSL